MYLQLQELAADWREMIDTLDPELAELYDDAERAEARFMIAKYEELASSLCVPASPDGLESHDEQTLIGEDDFEDYARQLAEDIGAIGAEYSWPSSCIDWGRAARELQMDYSSVEYDGVTYYYR